MKTFANKTSRQVGRVRARGQPTLQPMGPTNRMQKAEIRQILYGIGAQAKLIVSRPGDPAEREADLVADRVMRMPDPLLQRQAEKEEPEEETVQTREIQRQGEEEGEESEGTVQSELMHRQAEGSKEEEEEAEVSAKLKGGTPIITADVAASIQTMKGGGQALPRSTRAFFEPRFGHDFSRVRIHTDTRAAETAKGVNARAFTVGRDVVFGTGQYAPDTHGGRRLLAHELAHVVQRGGKAAKELQKKENDKPKAHPVITGSGLGSVIVYQGKTLVRLGGEKFYISGTPSSAMRLPPGGTTSVLFIYKKSNPNKMYRLDYDTLKVGPKAGAKGWEHNQKGVAKALRLSVTNHQPAGTLGKTAGRAITIFKWGGRAAFVIGLIGHGIEVYYAENKKRAIAKAGGALAGGVAGAWGGAKVGAGIGVWFGGPFGAAAGAFVGGVVGAGLGAWGGSKAVGYVYDIVATPLEKEEWVALRADQVIPTPETP